MKKNRWRILSGMLVCCMLASQTVWGAKQEEEDILTVTETMSEKDIAEESAPEGEPDHTYVEKEDMPEKEESGLPIDLLPEGPLPEESLPEEEYPPEDDSQEDELWQPGWFQRVDGSIRYYHSDGTFTKSGFEKIDGQSYYFDDNGCLKTGWLTLGNKVYYLKQTGDFGIKGHMLKGWQNIGSYRYYFDDNGEMQTGWLTYQDKVYYLKLTGEEGNKGHMLKGWQNIGGRRYYFGAAGEMQTGWLTYQSSVYYLKKSGDSGIKGCMLTGWQSIGSYQYHFSENGAMSLGWLESNGSLYYLKRTGDPGVKGHMLKGWQNISGSRYYLGSNGKLNTGWITSGGKIYYLKKMGDPGIKGRMLRGWQNIGGATYYFDTDGKMKTGWQEIGKYWFYFKATGSYGLRGRMFTGMQKVGSETYYFKKTGDAGIKGAMLMDYTYKTGSTAYYFGSDGAGEKIKTYTIRFYSSNGSSQYTELKDVVYKGESYTLPDLPDRLNYAAVGWSTKKNPSASSALKPGKTVTITGNMNFYGCWKKAKTVQFCYNNGSGEYKSLRENVTEDTLVLPSMCSPKGYTFLGWSNEPDQHGYPDYLMGEKITVSSGMKLYSVLIENPVPGPNTAAVSEAYDEIFFIGDSRTVGMKKWVNAQGEPVSSKATFYCKNGAGMDWYLENRSQIINGIKKTEGKKAVIWCLGANNLCYTTQSGYLQSVVDTYLNELAYLKKTLQSSGCDLYFLSVNPVNDKETASEDYGPVRAVRSPKWVLNFNYMIRTSKTGYTYIDTYNYLTDTGFQLLDGLHYTDAVYGKIYNKIIETIDKA